MPTLKGASLIAQKAATLPNLPGVYRMLGSQARVLYVGKARSLKKRVLQYTKLERQTQRIAHMIELTKDMEFIITDSEPEALLLEAQLIKKLKPAYNILLRDDKSFPLIELDENHEAPRLSKYREQPRKARKPNCEYFGPFVSADAVDRTLIALQRAFLLRSCSDNVYAHRTRPCLLYQIKRCAAPCTGEIALSDYQQLTAQAKDFLRGDSHLIHKKITTQMDKAAGDENYELAALYRDRLRALQKIQSQPGAHLPRTMNADLFALYREGGATCIQLFIIRTGQSLGNHSWFPKHNAQDKTEDIMESFIAQFYDTRKPPPALLIDMALPNHALLAEALSLKAGYPVQVTFPKRGVKKELLDNATRNAAEAFARRRAEIGSQKNMLQQLATKLNIAPPQRIEVYDNSHIQGAHALGAMIVATDEGLAKTHYRIFNMEPADKNDDTAMMKQMLERRFDINKEKPRKIENQPDLIILDGGKGQLNAARESLSSLSVPLLAIAKGAEHGRAKARAGKTEDFFFCPTPQAKKITQLHFLPDEPLFYYLQRLRDEAHRFAIHRHRQRHKKSNLKNPLDDIMGIGAKRKRQLLARFGSAKGVARASPKELESVQGISKKQAQMVYEHFHYE